MVPSQLLLNNLIVSLPLSLAELIELFDLRVVNLDFAVLADPSHRSLLGVGPTFRNLGLGERLFFVLDAHIRVDELRLSELRGCQHRNGAFGGATMAAGTPAHAAVVLTDYGRELFVANLAILFLLPLVLLDKL